MTYLIFSVPMENKNKVNDILKDDLISRQSITIRDAKAFEIKKEVQFVLIEGEEKALQRAKELFKDVSSLEQGQDAEEIYNKFKADEAGAAESVGFIFGD